MNNLEEKLFEAFNNPKAYSLHGKPGFELEIHLAEEAAKICLEIAQKAFAAGKEREYYEVHYGSNGSREDELRCPDFDQFKQEICG